MTFLDSIETCFKKSFQIKGRASRSEYWWFNLVYIMGWVILFSIDKPAIYDESGFYDSLIKIIFFIFLIMIIPGISVSIRRLHDINKSGALLFINIIPIIGPLLIFFMLIKEGTKGKNDYGQDPLKKSKK